MGCASLKYSWFHRSSFTNDSIVVLASMCASSTPLMVAKSATVSYESWVLSAVWCGPPAVSHASADVGRSGAGSHTARATGSFGNG
jgi:hypothetical protein